MCFKGSKNQLIALAQQFRGLEHHPDAPRFNLRDQGTYKTQPMSECVTEQENKSVFLPLKQSIVKK